MPWTKAPPLVRVPLDKLHQAEKGEAGYIENDNDGLASHTFRQANRRFSQYAAGGSKD